ncbi:DNA (cytosine-5-)-methyltransferase, partial [Sulfitobacter geojensis]|nr:DNA (cytosine-5-)-methyltransferase [Sulfitobacter geojensis]
MKPTRVASFFAGAGGLDLGFKQAGFDIVYASDIESDCCETLKLNRGSSTSDDSDIHCGDIRTIDFNTLPDDIDLVVGGPPCQSFSASGRRAGGAAGRLDDRGNLFEAYRDIIRHLQPQAFVFENV